MTKHQTKVLFDANSLMVQRTGVGYYTAQMIEHLAQLYPQTLFVGYYYNFLARKPRPIKPVGPNICYRPIYHFPGPIINLLRRFRIEVPVELLAFMRADFVFYPNFLTQPSLFRTPNAMVVHDLTFVDLPDYVAPKNLNDLQRFIPAHLKRTNFVVTVSEFGKQRIHQEFGVPLERIVVTPIPPEAPTPLSETKQKALLRQLGLPAEFILTLSTVEPRKNVLSMIDAFLLLPEALQKRYPLVVTGKVGWNCDQEVARLQQVKDEGKNIIHLDYVTEAQRTALYQTATIYTSASHYEGFGMTPLEAMSYGRPCALSDIPVFREVTGNNALYFNPQDPQSIAAAWQQLLTEPKLRQKYAVAGKRQAGSYDWDAVAGQLYARIADYL
ncbi:MAG TPA: glycosyltransferase family 1 protein [Candidatus Saccharimonadales bacterium]|nr:glycosyltransferase family 1 protein [Candidatus Saccharimonadales bacterium]